LARRKRGSDNPIFMGRDQRSRGCQSPTLPVIIPGRILTHLRRRALSAPLQPQTLRLTSSGGWARTVAYCRIRSKSWVADGGGKKGCE
jgi:hypothetical protein